MLKGLTNTFKNGCNNVELTYKEYVKLDNDIIPVKATLKDDVYENGNFIGTFILKEIQFETEATYEFRNKEFEYYKVVNGESIKIGTFISTDITINDTTEIVKVVGMDYGLKTQVEYTSSLDYASGNITLLDVWNECCTLSGLQSGISYFPNSDFIVDSDQFTGTGAMIRDVFKGIAMSSGSFVKVMNDDKIYLVFNEYTSENKTIEVNGNATINDGLKLEDLEIEGNTTQSGTPTPSSPVNIDVVTGRQVIDDVGKNLLIPNVTSTTTVAGEVTITPYYKNGVIDYYIINGTSTSSSAVFVNMFSYKGQPSTSYTLTGFVSNTNLRLRVWRGSGYVDNSNPTFTFTTTDTDTNYGIQLRIAPGGSFDNVKIQPMLRLSSITDDTYEPFKGQSYEINLGKNLLSSSLELGTYSDVGIKSGSSANYRNSTPIQVQPNTTYTFSINGVSQKYAVYYYNNTNTFISSKGLTTGTFTTPANCYYINFRCFNADWTSNYANLKVQIEKGSQASSYSAYKTPIELCKIGTYQDFIRKGTGKNLFDGVLELGGYVETSGQKDSKTDRYRNANPIPVQPNTTYTTSINGTAQQYVMCYYKSDGTFISNVDNRTGTFTTPDDCYYVNFRCYIADYTSNYANLKVQLEKGSQATLYEPYGYANKWYIYKAIGKVDLSSLTWTKQMDLADNYKLWYTTDITNIKYASVNTELINNYSEKYIKDTAAGMSGVGKRNHLAIDTSAVRVSALNSPTGLFYYPLATPTTTEITDTELISQLNAIELLEGLNNISITSNDLTGKLKLTYYNNELDIIEDYVELEDKRDTHPWTCLRLGMSQVDGNSVDYIDQELVAQYGENWLILNDNPFAYTQEKRQQLIMNIFNQIKEFGYSAFVSKTLFKPYLTSGDIIQFRNRDKKLVKSILLRYTHSGEQITLEAPSETSATINYIRPLDTTQALKNIQIIVNQDTQQITSINETVSSQNSNINNLTQLVDSQGNDIDALGTRLTQSVDSINASVSAVQQEINNGVGLVKTTSATLDDNGLSISTDTLKIKTTMTNNSFEIKDSGGNSLAFFGYDETEGISKAVMDNLTVTNYFIAGVHRIETYEEDGEERTGYFYIGG